MKKTFFPPTYYSSKAPPITPFSSITKIYLDMESKKNLEESNVKKALNIIGQEEADIDSLFGEDSTNQMLIELLHEEAQKIAKKPEPDHENIVHILNQVIALNSERLLAHFNRGQSLFALGRYKDAALDFTKEIEFHDDDPKASSSYFERARCYFETKEIHLAAQDFRKYQELEDNQEIPPNLVTNLQSKINDGLNELRKEAWGKFNEAENCKVQDPEKAEIKHLESLQIFGQLIEAEPERHGVYFDRGKVFAALGLYDEAALDFTEELDLHADDPGVFRSYFERAKCYFEMKKIHLAERDFKEYKKFDTNHEVNKIDAKNLHSKISDEKNRLTKLHEKAKQKLRETDNSSEEVTKEVTKGSLASLKLLDLEVDPKRPQAYYDRVLALMRLNKFQEAISNFEKELKINPSEDYQQNRRYQKATAEKNLQKIEDLQKALKAKQEERFRIANYDPISPQILLICILGVAIGATMMGCAFANIDRKPTSDALRKKDDAIKYLQNFARLAVDNDIEPELINYLFKNFHKLPDDFFQKTIKSINPEELEKFLNEQLFLKDNDSAKNNLIETFKQIKKYEEDVLVKDSDPPIKKNYLMDLLLKNNNSQDYATEKAMMTEAIEVFENEVARYFQECCKNPSGDENINKTEPTTIPRIISRSNSKENLASNGASNGAIIDVG